jgi:hypothetical protein
MMAKYSAKYVTVLHEMECTYGVDAVKLFDNYYL